MGDGRGTTEGCGKMYFRGQLRQFPQKWLLSEGLQASGAQSRAPRDQQPQRHLGTRWNAPSPAPTQT